jgi:hypothetical protein
MPELLASDTANALAASALYQQGKSSREVAQILGCSPATAWRLKHRELLDPALIQHVSQTIATKAMLGANAAIDTLLDKAESDELKESTPAALAKTASILLQSATAYAASSGAKDTFLQMVEEFGLQTSHTSSTLTVTQRVTLTSSTPAPVALEAEVMELEPGE